MRTFARFVLICAVLWAQVFALAPSAGAQTPQRLTATWNPGKVTAAELAGICPTAIQPDAACPISRGETYTASVQVIFDQPADSMIIQADGGGLDIQALSASTGGDFTRAVAAGQPETIDLVITIPEPDVRRQRDFYLGRVSLVGGRSFVSGSLLISLVIPRPRVQWTRLLDPATRENAPLETTVGSGGSFTRTTTIRPNIDIPDFAVKSNSDRITITGLPATLSAGQVYQATIRFDAEIVTRRTRADVVLRPTSGFQPLAGTMRMRIVILPAELRWSPPMVRESLFVQDQRPTIKTVQVTSNYDIDNVIFRTADIGLNPIVAPRAPVNLRAGVPQNVTFWMCPGYAPTTYFISIGAYQGSKPLNRRLPIRMRVDDNGRGLPDVTRDPCAAATR